MSTLAAGGGGYSASDSSSASSGPSHSGSVSGPVFNFGGINLGSQDIPLSGAAASGDTSIPTLGTIPPGTNYPNTFLGGQVQSSSSILPIALILAAGLALWLLLKR